MFLQLLETLGTFFGGLGAFIAATTQLLTFLKKKEEERGGGSGATTQSACGGDDPADSWMIPAGVTAHLATAF